MSRDEVKVCYDELMSYVSDYNEIKDKNDSYLDGINSCVSSFESGKIWSGDLAEKYSSNFFAYYDAIKGNTDSYLDGLANWISCASSNYQTADEEDE